jgi:hypothetical protein
LNGRRAKQRRRQLAAERTRAALSPTKRDLLQQNRIERDQRLGKVAQQHANALKKLNGEFAERRRAIYREYDGRRNAIIAGPEQHEEPPPVAAIPPALEPFAEPEPTAEALSDELGVPRRRRLAELLRRRLRVEREAAEAATRNVFEARWRQWDKRRVEHETLAEERRQLRVDVQS